MKKKTIIIAIIVVVLIAIIALVVSGGKKDAAISYRSTADKISTLVREYSAVTDPSSQEARELLDKINKLLATQKKQGSGDENSIVVPVYVDEVERGMIAKSLTYVGDVRAQTMVRLYSKVPDRINKFFIENGDYVNVGDPIAQIENSRLKDAVNQANAGLNTALAQLLNVQEEFKRATALYEAKAMSQSQYDQIKTQKEVTEEAVKQARAASTSINSSLADALIKAPIAGIVADRVLEEGDMAAGQIPIANIYQMDSVKIVVQMAEAEVGKVRIGMNATLTVAAYPGTEFRGKMVKISPVINPQTRTVEAEIAVANANRQLKPGMFAEVKILLQEKLNTLLISKSDVDTKTSQISTGDGLRDSKVITNYSVYVIQDSLARFRPIKVGIESDQVYEVLSGLMEGDRVVSVGRTILSDSTQVSIKN